MTSFGHLPKDFASVPSGAPRSFPFKTSSEEGGFGESREPLEKPPGPSTERIPSLDPALRSPPAGRCSEGACQPRSSASTHRDAPQGGRESCVAYREASALQSLRYVAGIFLLLAYCQQPASFLMTSHGSCRLGDVVEGKAAVRLTEALLGEILSVTLGQPRGRARGRVRPQRPEARPR